MGRGDVLEMITTDRDSLREVRTLVNTLGDELLAIETVGNHYRFLIESRSPSQKKPVRSLRTALASHLGTALRNIGVPALTFTT